MCSDGIDGAVMRASVRLQWGGDGRSVVRLRQGVLGAGSVLGFGRQEVQPAQGDVWQKSEPAQQENAAGIALTVSVRQRVPKVLA